MNLGQARHSEAGMTLFEVGVVVAVVLMIAVVLLPTLASTRRKTSRVGCVDNLKQVGLAYRIWEQDNGDIYPMGISVTNGGSLETVQAGNPRLSFQVMSNELGSAKIICCPNDSTRTAALGFAGLNNSNISYFAAVDTTNESNPQALLSGDSNFEIKGVPVKPGLFSVWTNDPVGWAPTRHFGTGNIGLGDGSVQSVVSVGLKYYLEQTGFETNRLAIP
jgi:type II secretory pathway pseudopilin PulG